jgi:glutamate 5-kinase
MSKILVKLGSSSITDGKGIDLEKLQNILGDIVNLKQESHEVIIVSSGAIATGKHFVKAYDKTLIHSQQAASAIGQPLLMNEYIKYFSGKQLACAQILLTHEDFKRRISYFNCQKMLTHLLHNNIIPIINENDSVSFAEITLGDNDQLAGYLALMLNVDHCLFLTEADGLLDANKNTISEVSSEENFSFIRYHKKTSTGTGGIQNKLEAIRKITDAGIDVYLGSYKDKRPLKRLLDRAGGSHFLAVSEKQTNRKQKIRSSAKVGAFITVDEGAAKALTKNASLLPSGIAQVVGTFHRGDSVAIRHQRAVIAYGEVEYSSKEVTKLKGKKSTDIQNLLGYHLTDVIIHKDNLVMVKK